MEKFFEYLMEEIRMLIYLNVELSLENEKLRELLDSYENEAYTEDPTTYIDRPADSIPWDIIIIVDDEEDTDKD